jgi:hypothetical protein
MPDWWDEMRMLGKTAPYQVRILTATSADARAVTRTSNAYLAGLGAVITYRAEARPLAITSFAACGLPMTLAVRACSSLWWPVMLPPVQPASDCEQAGRGEASSGAPHDTSVGQDGLGGAICSNA